MQESVFIFFTTKALLFREITGFFEHKTYVRFFESVCTYCFFVAVLKGKLHFSVLPNPCFDRHALRSCRAASRAITKTPAHISKFCQKKTVPKTVRFNTLCGIQKIEKKKHVSIFRTEGDLQTVKRRTQTRTGRRTPIFSSTGIICVSSCTR